MTHPPLTVATYNHMFGFDGSSMWQNFVSHFWLHGVGSLKRAERKSNPQRTLDLIPQIEADILGICEILGEKQETFMREELTKLGYTSIHTEDGHRIKRQQAFVKNLVATKMPSVLKPFPHIDRKSKGGYGGGIVWIYIPEFDTDVIHVHMPQPRGKIYRSFVQQLEKILEIMQQEFTGKRALILGDFNCRYRKLTANYPAFAEMDHLSPYEPTCSLTPGFRRLLYWDLDHILGKGFSLVENGTMRGKSDHALIWAKLTPQ